MPDRIEFVLGNEEMLETMPGLAGKTPFSPEILEFCSAVSKELMKTPETRNYPDIVTLGFWLRRGFTEKLKERFLVKDGNIHIGRGMIFHIAPSNVPVNFAYSLFTGLLCGNTNVVRIPSKDFPQIQLIVDAIKNALNICPDMKPYLCLVRYGHEQEINDRLSAMCDVRIIWGGDAVVAEIRKSPLKPRASEITFADRFSLAVIDVSAYILAGEKEKKRSARAFYNDTYLTDQNACTSPRTVVWLDTAKNRKEEIAAARKEFWSRLWGIIRKEYVFQDIQGVDKLTQKYMLAANDEISVSGNRISTEVDNRLVCVEINRIIKELPDYFDNAGFFLEYVSENISDLIELCNDDRCQTIGYWGKKEMMIPLLEAGVRGVDRIVPVGHTMDFDLIWDGYNLVERLTRVIDLGL